MKPKVSRRDFLKWVSAVGGAIAARMAGWVPEVQAAPTRISAQTKPARHEFFAHVTTEPATEGELYEGFLLLPDGAPVPATVEQPKLGIPIVCGIGAGSGVQPTAITELIDSDATLANKIAFPMYTFKNLPVENGGSLRRADANLMRHSTGEVFAATIAFQAHNKISGNWETAISIWAEPDFPRPFPLWSSEPVEPNGPAVILEKVDFLPSPAIGVSTKTGYVFHWINNDVLYTLTMENNPSRDEARKLASLLAVVG